MGSMRVSEPHIEHLSPHPVFACISCSRSKGDSFINEGGSKTLCPTLPKCSVKDVGQRIHFNELHLCMHGLIDFAFIEDT